jgi:predicted homoserine dehydrogenase-like protein
MSIWRRLERHAADKGEADVAVVGAGYVGTSIVAELHRAPGMRPAVVANRTVDRAVEAYRLAGFDPADVVVSEDPGRLADAVVAGRPAVCPSAELLGSLPVQVVVEATGALSYGARSILDCLDAGQDVVSYNAEVDGLLASLFHDRARRSGAVYTIADGDQPGVLLRLIDQVQGMGFEIIAALNCKRHLDVHQTPGTGADYMARDSTSAIMTTAFGDGTKMQVEMAVVANATGLVPVQRGMLGIETTVEEAAVAIPAALGGRRGVVDYTLRGDFGAGVGVIGRHVTPELVEKPLRFYKMGDGPDYFFFRPYHLVHLELPLSIAEVVLDREPLGVVDGPHVAETVAMAKRDLRAGEALDCIGGFTVYGLTDNAEGAAGHLPIGLAAHARMTRDVAADGPLPLAAVELDEDEPVVRLWRELHGLTVGA